MPIHRLRNCVAFFAIAAGTAYPGCSTKAVGVEECRQVEYTRCEAAPQCPEQFDVTDVEQCKLFYRDHCLHGLPVATAPNGATLKRCLDTIRSLSQCAAEHDGTAALLVTCTDPVDTTDPKITKVCKLLGAPEAIKECSSFLSADSSPGGESGASSTGTGGATAADTGGSSSNGGSSGFGGLTL